MADSALDCQKCGKQMRLPRPTRGCYAAPSEPQLEEAELYGVEVRLGMHRGELKELLGKAANDRTRTPAKDAFEHYHERKIARQIREAEETIAEATAKLNGSRLGEAETYELRRTLQDAESLRDDIIRSERERKEDEKRFAKEEARQEAEIRSALYESEFARGGDWNEFYRKPTRKQFDTIYSWLESNRPGWTGIRDVADAIDRLFPELKK